ncbi:MAG: hypothetical protein KatS3mg070_2203 [Meiothermus sp.]|uniref:DNA-processing protein DprA n=1 Tax=Meiothermus sp. TaxID=1955249 RepID=UPI0021DD83CF|nr:DNA-processing protein DprA [Meiothermus sp.]GIW28840.1 MAG: hypothetical protein KatS3mg070_2203 [Meiothermus sp.]
MNPLYWMLLAHSGLKTAEKMQILRAAGGNLEGFVEGGLPGLSGNTRAVMEKILEEAAATGFLLEELKRQGIRVIPGAAPEYPVRLKQTLRQNTPLVLYVAGEVSLLQSKRSIAIVGSRNASPEALELTRRAGRYFGKEGYAVVTGMARGADLEAFHGVREVAGKAIGVLPYGISAKETFKLLREYQEDIFSGRLALLSELHPDAPWKAQYAMMRNRIVVALSDALLVAQTGLKETVEQGKKRMSGTWDAVAQAKRLGRPAFVFDLPIEGNQALIAQGMAQPLPAFPGDQTFMQLEDTLSPPAKKSRETPIQPPLLTPE